MKEPLILASRSPRRRVILEMAGIPFRQIPGDVLETTLDDTPENVVVHWAHEKAEYVLNSGKVAADSPVLGADTMVCLKDKLLGKPADGEEATEMLKLLSGRWHTVFGGVCFLYRPLGLVLELCERTDVKFRNLENEEIKAYVETGEPLDKAGSYGIQGYGSMLVETIEGCFFNVMGLPVSRFVKELRSNLKKSM
ncbi:MAG: septum formation protein Maf [Candidatus Aegiribacteria sp.]|nr:septum formation protein Maf [Candidatus Aegiribacteria sp.]MBD3295064.1 septum formation protein Maf [Candidatus Fermentibacteria bacterium]